MFIKYFEGNLVLTVKWPKKTSKTDKFFITYIALQNAKNNSNEKDSDKISKYREIISKEVGRIERKHYISTSSRQNNLTKTLLIIFVCM